MYGDLMKRIIPGILFILMLSHLEAASPVSRPATPWDKEYEKLLMVKVGEQVPLLATCPSTIYPNTDYTEIFNKFPEGKLLIFGYGSLINWDSAGRTVGMNALQSMTPVIAFGFKRLFNYKASNVSNWGTNLPSNERAMLNIIPMTTFNQIINGVVMEVSHEDLRELVRREKGYDLVPMLVADWGEVISQNPHIKIKVAYTFLVPDEMRSNIDYTHTKYYPVRGYLHAVEKGAADYGPKYLDFWKDTTYLGDGTTSVRKWNAKTFSGILDVKEP